MKGFNADAFYFALKQLLANYDTHKSNVTSYREQLLARRGEQHHVLLRDIADAFSGCHVDEDAIYSGKGRR